MADVEVEVRNAANTSGTTALSGASNVSWQHQRNAMGRGSFCLDNADAGVISEGDIIRGRLGGTGRFPWIVERREPTIVSLSDEGVEATKFSGRGLLCEWDDSKLHDPPTLSNLAQTVPVLDDRVMAWYGPDYDPTGDGWTAANVIAVQGFASMFYTGLPAECADNTALWIGPSTGDDDDAPEGTNLFARWVLIGEGAASLDYAGDNYVVAYVNGRRVGEGGDFRRRQRYEFEVTTAGWLYLCFELVNGPDDGPPGGNPTALLWYLLDAAGGVIAHSDTDTYILEYPSTIPEIPLGRQIRQVMIGNDLLDGVWSVGGTETTDANGADYPLTGPMSYRLGSDSPWDVVSQLCDSFIDIKVDASGRTLYPYVKGTVGSASTLDLVTGYSAAGIADPDAVNVVDLKWDVQRPAYTALVVRWARGRFTRGTGDRWGTLDLGQVTDLSTAEDIADGLLDLAAERESAAAFELDPVDSTEWPYTAFAVHDTLAVPGPFDDNDTLTQAVTAITVTGDENGDVGENSFVVAVGSLVEDKGTLLTRASKRGSSTGALGGTASAAAAPVVAPAASIPATGGLWTLFSTLPSGTVGTEPSETRPPGVGYVPELVLESIGTGTGTTTVEVSVDGTLVATLSMGSSSTKDVASLGETWTPSNKITVTPTADGGHVNVRLSAAYSVVR